MTHLAVVFESLVLKHHHIDQAGYEGHEQNEEEADTHRGEEAAHQAGRHSQAQKDYPEQAVGEEPRRPARAVLHGAEEAADGLKQEQKDECEAELAVHRTKVRAWYHRNGNEEAHTREQLREQREALVPYKPPAVGSNSPTVA